MLQLDCSSERQWLCLRFVSKERKNLSYSIFRNWAASDIKIHISYWKLSNRAERKYIWFLLQVNDFNETDRLEIGAESLNNFFFKSLSRKRPEICFHKSGNDCF